MLTTGRIDHRLFTRTSAESKEFDFQINANKQKMTITGEGIKIAWRGIPDGVQCTTVERRTDLTQIVWMKKYIPTVDTSVTFSVPH